MTELKRNSDFSTLAIDHPARAFKNIQDRLSIDRDEQGNEVMLKDSQKTRSEALDLEGAPPS